MANAWPEINKSKIDLLEAVPLDVYLVILSPFSATSCRACCGNVCNISVYISLSRTAMITNIDLILCSYKFHNPCPHLRCVQLSTITLHKRHQHKQSKTFFSIFFLDGSHLNIKEDNILKYKSLNFDSFIIFLPIKSKCWAYYIYSNTIISSGVPANPVIDDNIIDFHNSGKNYAHVFHTNVSVMAILLVLIWSQSRYLLHGPSLKNFLIDTNMFGWHEFCLILSNVGHLGFYPQCNFLATLWPHN